MKKVPLVWTKLREWNGSLQTAFETLCNHFAAYETVPQGATFVPVAPPDGGVESYWIFPDGTEWGFQAKFFTAKPESSEWSQIDKSIQRALDTHPDLTRYTVCLPIDRADPRKEDKEYFKDAWDTHEEKWIDWAKEKGRTVQFDYWGEAELSERFAQERHAGRYYFWFHSELFSDAWFADQLNRAKENAGARYTPELNVDLPIAQVFDGLYRSKAFFQGLGKLQKEVRKYSKFRVTEADAFAKDEIDKINAATNSVHHCLDRALQTSNEQPVALQSLVDAAEAGRLAAEELSTALTKFEEKKRKEISEKYGEEELHNRQAMQSMYDDQRSRLRYLINSLYELSGFCESPEGMAANAPALLVSGAGGCGKTHLLCDVAFRQHKNGAPAVLLLGQQFDTTNPWSQVLDQLGLDCTRDEFLRALAWTKGDRGQRLVKKVCVTVEGYLKERVYDCSIEDAIHLKLPAKTIAEGMFLRWSVKDGVFCDAAGKEIAFDPTAKEIGPGALLIRQEEFQQYLLDNDLEFFWTVLGAKQGMHGHMSRKTWSGELQISGVFRLVNGEVIGNLTTELIDRP